MNYRVFCNYMNTIMNAIDAQDNHHETNAEKVFEIHGRWALARLEQLFHDHDQNIRRWLNGKPCVIQNDQAGNKVELSIGQDMEALYYVLVLCKRIANGKEISAEFREFFSLIIRRSCTADEDWEEC